MSTAIRPFSASRTVCPASARSFAARSRMNAASSTTRILAIGLSVPSRRWDRCGTRARFDRFAARFCPGGVVSRASKLPDDIDALDEESAAPDRELNRPAALAAELARVERKAGSVEAGLDGLRVAPADLEAVRGEGEHCRATDGAEP